MTELDIFLRGGGALLAIFLIIHCVMARKHLPFWSACCWFLASEVAYILVSTPLFDPILGRSEILFVGLARIGPALLWWFALSLYDEHRPVGVLPGLIVVLTLIPVVLDPVASSLAHNILLLCILGHITWISMQGYQGDLVAPRRTFRLAIIGVSVVVGGAIGVTEMVFPAAERNETLLLMSALKFAIIFMGFSLWITKLNYELMTPTRPTGALYDDSDQEQEMVRLHQLLQGDIHRTEGLTVASLAEAMEIPEHRLRRLINQHMGYRNISELINDRRIDDAKDKLSDPSLRGRQIAQIAFDVGYGSLAPFNRAFRSRTGQSPKEYRTAHMPEDLEFEQESADLVPLRA